MTPSIEQMGTRRSGPKNLFPVVLLMSYYLVDWTIRSDPLVSLVEGRPTECFVD
jgi:hypothetical protein